MNKKRLFYGVFVLVLMLGLVLTACGKKKEEPIPSPTSSLTIEIESANDIEVAYDSVFNVLDGVKAKGSDGVDYSDKITYITTSTAINKDTNILDTKKAGIHAVRYEVKVNDVVARKFRYITVAGPAAVEGQMLINAEFSDGTTGWDDPKVVYIADGADLKLFNEDSALKAEVVAGANPYTPRFGQMNVPFENGKTYEISFDAKSSAEKVINLQAGELLDGAPYFVNFLAQGQIEHRLIKTTMDRYSFKFTMTQDNPRGGILFELGAIDGQKVDATMYFDNVTIEESTPDPDVIGPVFSGVQAEVSINKNSTFNPLAGITALDNTDGDVTNKITYTIYKNGSTKTVKTIDSSAAAVYKIVYSVKDSLGNASTARTKLIIVDKSYKDTGKIKNGDFSATDLTPWKSWMQNWGDMPNVTVKLANGAAEITTDKPGDANWAIQFIQSNVKLEEGKSYNLQFDAKASVARDINVVFYNATTGINYLAPTSTMLSTTLKTYELLFTMTGETIDTDLQFLLGKTDKFAAGKVTIDNVKLLEVEVTGPDVTAPKFKGVNENVTLTLGDTFNPLKGITANDLKDGDLTNKITYSIKKDGITVNQIDTSTTGVYMITYIVKDKSNNATSASSTITIVASFVDTGAIVNGDFSAADLTPWKSWSQNWGDMPTVSVNIVNGAVEINTDKGGDANWAIQFIQSDIMLLKGKTYKLKFDAKASVARDINAVFYSSVTSTNYLKPSSIELGTNFKTIELPFTMDGDSIKTDLQFLLGKTDKFAAGTVTIDNVQLLTVDTSGEPDTEDPSFNGVKSSVTISVGDEFDLLSGITAIDSNDGDVTEDISYTITLDGDTVDQLDTSVAGVYTISYSVKDASNNEATATTTLTIADLTYNDTSEIQNGDFSAADLSPWSNWSQNWGNFPTVTVNLVNGAAEITTDKGGDANWAIQFIQSGISLEEGRMYKLVFDAKASVARDINAVFYSSVTSTNYLSATPIALDTNFKTIALKFTMNKASIDADLQFLLGNTANFAAGTVTIDNVKLLVAEETGPDVKAPKLKGVQDDVTITVGDTYDPLDGITASDSKDGDVTDDITYTITLDGNTVDKIDTSAEGEYVISYSVKDTSDNEATATTNLHIIGAKFSNTGEIANGDFSGSDLTPWKSWWQNWGDQPSVSVNLVNGAAEITTDKGGDANWAIQFIQSNVALVKGKTYKLIFDAKASAARDINVVFYNSVASKNYMNSGSVALGTDFKTIELKFTMTDDSTFADLQFLLGNTASFAAGTVTIDNVKLLEQGDHFNDSAEIANGDFSGADLTPWSNWSQNWGNFPTVTVNLVNGAAEIETDKGGDANWAIQFNQAGVSLEKGKTYRLVFDAKATAARDINVVFYNSIVSKNFFESGSVMLGTNFTPYEFTFTMTDDSNVADLQYLLGNTANFAAGTITIDNVKLLEQGPELIDTGAIVNGDFSGADLTPWTNWSQNWGDFPTVTVNLVNGAVEIATDKGGDANWAIQFKLANVSLVKGKSYQLQFDAKASVARDINVVFYDTVASKNYLQSGSVMIDTDFKTIKLPFTMTDDTALADLQFLLGNTTNFAAGTVTVDNVKLLEIVEY